MTMIRSLLCASLLLIGACTQTGEAGLARAVGGGQWVLVRVELDQSLLANSGSLPVLRAAGEGAFGQAPWAMGTFGVTREGQVVSRVQFAEPVPDSGRVFRYDVLDFVGFISDDRTQVVRLDAPSDAPLGYPTALRYDETAEGLIRIQPTTGDRRLPYTFTFAPPPAPAERVLIPTVR
jgi:hypothetical protein